MNRILRVVVLSGALTLLTCPVFAQSTGDPGGGDPLPPPTNNTTITTATTATTAIATLLAYFGL